MVDDAALPSQPPDTATPAAGAVTPASAQVLHLADASKAKAAKATIDPQAHAPATGAGEDAAASAKKPAKLPKKEKVVDWGRYNFLLENFTLIYPTDTAWDAAKRKIVKLSNMAHAHGSGMVRGWKESPDRKTVDDTDVVFDPSFSCAPKCINLYDGFAIVPLPCTEADVSPALDLLRHLCSTSASTGVSVDDVMRWTLCWLAYPFQHPGAKLRTAMVFHGPQGTGKNMFFDMIRSMYGKYGVMVGQNELEEKFNDWLSAKCLVIGNEVVTRQELFHNKNKLKWIITEDQIPIRAMQQSVRWEANHANVCFLSNESQPLVLENDDRRHMVIYTPLADENGLYLRMQAFLQDGGAAKFMHYLLHYDLAGFVEHSKPLLTQAKVDLQELSMRPAERFMSEWVAGFLGLPIQVCSGEQLYRAFETWARRSGVRWTDESAKFTNQAKRWITERLERDANGVRKDPLLDYKVIQLKDDLANNGRKAMRCWIPRGCEPLNGVTMGEWAAESIAAYELPLGRYLRARNEGDPVESTSK